MADVRFITLPPDSRSEHALWLMPSRGNPPAEVLIHAGGLKQIDAWGATALRTGIELWARHQQQQVSVSQPTDSAAWLLLYHLLADDCPAHLILTDDSSRPTGRCPSAILLPTARITSIHDADALSESLLARNAGRLTPALRFLAAELPELAQNALQHGTKSVTDPVACCFYDRHEDELQLLVSDLGSTYSQGADAERVFEMRFERSQMARSRRLENSPKHAVWTRR